MIIALGSDHRGTEVRDHVRDVLEQSGHEVRLFTAPDGDGKSCDYPDVAHPVGRSVAGGETERGILICGSGIGMSISANKVTGVRAGLVHDEVGARMSLCVQDENPPYRYVSVEGPVTAIQSYTIDRDMLPMAQRYLGEKGGEAYVAPQRAGHSEADSIKVVVRPERWLTLDLNKA